MQLKSPKWTKYKKYHKNKLNLKIKSKLLTTHTFGIFKLVALEPGRISSRQFNVIMRTSRKILKKNGKLWLLGFPHFPVTSKPLEVRMGKGKGSVKYWAMPIKAGSVLLELSNVSVQQAFKALDSAKKKLPIKSKTICFLKEIQ